MRYVYIALTAIALIAVCIFSFQNLQAIEVSFLNWSVNTSKFIVIIGSYLLGMVTGWGLFGVFKHAMKRPAETKAEA